MRAELGKQAHVLLLMRTLDEDFYVQNLACAALKVLCAWDRLKAR